MQYSFFILSYGIFFNSPNIFLNPGYSREESEPKNKLRFLSGKNQRAEEPACLMKGKSIG